MSYDFLSRLYEQYCNFEEIHLADLPSIYKEELYRAICFPNDDAHAKGAILYGLIKDDAGLIKAVYEALTVNRSHSIRVFTAQLLIERNSVKARDLIVYLIMQGSLLYRRQLLEALGKIADKEDRQIENMFRRFLRYGDQNTVEGAIRGVANWGNERLLYEIIKCLQKHTNEKIRLAALQALEGFKNDGVR